MSNIGKGSKAGDEKPTDDSDYPMLGSVWKASSVKVICAFIASKAYDLDDGSPEAKARNVCAWAFAELDHIFDSADRELTEHEIRRSSYAAYAYLSTYSWLAEQAANLGLALYRIRPKHHYFQHIIDRTAEDKQNPRSLSCTGEETFMGIMKRIGKACHGSSIYTRIFQRYLLYVAIRWKRRRESGKFLVS